MSIIIIISIISIMKIHQSATLSLLDIIMLSHVLNHDMIQFHMQLMKLRAEIR